MTPRPPEALIIGAGIGGLACALALHRAGIRARVFEAVELQYSIHRGALQLLLVTAVRERLGADAVACGHALSAFEQDPARVMAHFTNRRTGQKERLRKAIV